MPNHKVLLVLAHGIFGWGDASSGATDPSLDYYYGVKPFVRDQYGSHLAGLLAPTVPVSESVEVRGTALKRTIEEGLQSTPAGTRVHIIAHSMGGLDARWVIAKGGMADRVGSLTTIATPHRGTSLGDLAYRLRDPVRGVGRLLDTIGDLRREFSELLARFGLPNGEDKLVFYHRLLHNVIERSSPDEMERGLYALTHEGAEQLNKELDAIEREIRSREQNPVAYVAYGGVYGSHPVALLKVSWDLMGLTGTQVEKTTGNDGAVSVWSAHYPWDDDGTHYVRTLPFDHFKQINWEIPKRSENPDMPRELQAVYREIMDRILSLAP